MIISNSEADTWDSCERLHYYKFGLGLQPLQNTRAIKIGNAGHKVFETFYKAILATGDRKEAYIAGVFESQSMLDKVTREEDVDVVSLVRSRLDSYVREYRDKDWRVVGVEDFHEITLSPGIQYGMRLDLLVECIDGPWRGQMLLVDHKFLSNFYSAEDAKMNPQLPKYIWTLQQKGFNIKRGMLNQVSSRLSNQDPTKMFQRTIVTPSETRMRAMMGEQFKAAQLIEQRLQLTTQEYEQRALRHLSSWQCHDCPFQLPCSLSLDGNDHQAEKVLKYDYRRSDYGYRKTREGTPEIP